MPAKNGFALQDADIDIIDSVFELRLATLDHLMALTGRGPKALQRRVLKLTGRRYLSRITRFMQKNVYAIGSEGVAALIDLKHAPQEIAEKRLRFHELKEFGLRHELFISGIHAKLILETRPTSIKLAWRQDRSTWDMATVRDEHGRPVTVPIRPDAYFVLEDAQRPDGKNKLHYLIEADRGTMARDRVAKKIQAYLAYHAAQRFQKKYPGMKSFHVAIVTETRGHRQFA